MQAQPFFCGIHARHVKVDLLAIFATPKDSACMSDQPTGAGLSDYDLVGGGPAVSAVVDDFYERVLRDPQLVQYFEGVDVARLKRHQVLLISQVLGGPADYDGRPLDQAHAGLGISHDDLAAVASHLVGAMREARVPEDILLRAIAVVASTEPDIVESRSP
jgi:hemoglobin